LRRGIAVGLLAAAVVVTVGVAIYYGYTRLLLFELLQPRNLLLSEREKLGNSSLGPMQHVAFTSQVESAPRRVLTLRQAELAFYGEDSFRVDIDPRVLAFFAETRADAAFLVLRRLGITHVFLPEEPYPSLYNSVLQSILHSGRFIARRDRYGRSILFTLRTEMLAESLVAGLAGTQISLGKFPWTNANGHGLVQENDRVQLSRHRLSFSTGLRKPLAGTEAMLAFDLASVALSGLPAPLQRDVCAVGLELRMKIGGHGLVRLVAEVASKTRENTSERFVLWVGMVSGGPREVSGQFWNPFLHSRGGGCDPAKVRIEASLDGAGEVWLESPIVVNSGLKRLDDSEIERFQALDAGWMIEGASTTARLAMRESHGQAKREIEVRHFSAYPLFLLSPPFPVQGDIDRLMVRWRETGRGRRVASIVCAREASSPPREVAEPGTVGGDISPGHLVATHAAERYAADLGDEVVSNASLLLPRCSPEDGGERSFRLIFALHRLPPADGEPLGSRLVVRQLELGGLPGYTALL
jgi:hypothetical protein